MKYCAFILFILWTASHAYGQQDSLDSLLLEADAKRLNGLHSEAIAKYEALLSKVDTGNVAYGDVIYGLAESHFSSRKYQEALAFYETCAATLSSIAEKRAKLRRVYGRLGYIYLYINLELKKAKRALKTENELLVALDSLASTGDKFRNCYALASVSRLLKDYNTGLNYAFQALDLAQDTGNSSTRNQAFAYSVIANLLGGMRAFEEATQYYLKKIEVSEKLYGPNHVSIANDYNNLGLTLYEARDYESAENYLKKALSILEKDTLNIRYLSNSYTHLGATYLKAGRLEESRQYLQKAAIVSKGIPIQESLTFENRALLYMAQQDYDSALICYQKALGAIIEDFEWTQVEENPTPEQLFTEPFHFELLNSKAACWLEKFKHTRNNDALDEAYRAFEIADALTDAYRNNFALESSRLFFQNWNYNHYADAMEATFLRYQATGEANLVAEAWSLIEKNKSLLMLENLLSAERVENLQVPDSLISIQNQVSASVWNLERDLRNCREKEDCADSTMIQIRQKLANSEAELEQSRNTIRTLAPDYYQITGDERIWRLEEVRDRLHRGETIINYFSGSDAYYLVATNGRDHLYHRIEKSAPLQEAIGGFLQEVSGTAMTNGSLSEGYSRFTKDAQLIFTQLLRPVLEKYDADKVIIIPDGLLALLPFEALITSSPQSDRVDYATLPYLMHDLEIGYGYSATLWAKNQDGEPLQSDASLVAFGTSGFSNQGLSDLPGSKAEVMALKRISNSLVRMDLEATESNFKNSVQSSDIIHLALHNQNDQSNPLNSRLVFSEASDSEQDGNLHLFELYGLNMNPGLVVLSACETGVGEWQQGEGAYHMGRGFLYHGNPALVLSLWKVRDKAAASLMSKFYAGIDEGIVSTAALRMAKLEYLNKADELTAHPSNWAAFVGVGEVQKRGKEGKLTVLIGLISLVLLIVLIMSGKRLLPSPVKFRDNRS